MVRSANGGGRPAFSVVNGPASTTSSDCGGVEFTKEYVDALLNEKMKTKNKFNLKEKCEQMMDYIKRLRLCIKCFQEIEEHYVLEHEKLANLLEFAGNKCTEMEVLMKAKEEELNSIIMELRRNYATVQEKFTKEETDKLAVMESFLKEKEARIIAERSHNSQLQVITKNMQSLLERNSFFEEDEGRGKIEKKK